MSLFKMKGNNSSASSQLAKLARFKQQIKKHQDIRLLQLKYGEEQDILMEMIPSTNKLELMLMEREILFNEIVPLVEERLDFKEKIDEKFKEIENFPEPTSLKEFNQLKLSKFQLNELKTQEMIREVQISIKVKSLDSQTENIENFLDENLRTIAKYEIVLELEKMEEENNMNMWR